MLSEVVNFNTSGEIWESFKRTFAMRCKAKAMQYKRLPQIQNKGNHSMKKYFNKMKSYADLLASFGHIMLEDNIVKRVLTGLLPDLIHS